MTTNNPDSDKSSPEGQGKKRPIFRVNVFYQQETEDLIYENRVGCIFVQAIDLDHAQNRANEMVQKTLLERKLKVPYTLLTSLSSKDEMDFFCANKSTKIYNGILN